ncbi:bifunctional diguanylate cyclase/phosphodiesterase [Pararhizobium antarcticum]|uniref:Histidine kinase n=1 Tax=Pararhizobium antarcticum TaxID=1798805 RepID=A0A657LYA7_9HYPH|nr:EAL domain-containing protein [Pararhizobium antarcticum]OJF96568.1 histidine kinase [Rhizobium sp. 58]OJG01427.1 histidine kinase [Pararhizobium antarcticum]
MPERPRTTRWLTANHLPSLLVLIVVIAAGIFAEQQNREVHHAKLREEVATALNPIRSKLEANINGDIQLVRGLIATISTEPGMDQKRFSQLARHLFNEQSRLRSIAAAPNLVVSLVYPLEENRKALGLDYRKNEDQRAAAERVKETARMVMAGPLSLVQGGEGLIGRFPVFISGHGGTNSFWGILSAVIDVPRLYQDSGLLAAASDIDIAIIGRDGLGEDGEQFYGSPTIRALDPVVRNIFLHSGSWQVMATPKGGWQREPPNTWQLRVLVATGGLFILVPMFLTGRLMEERQGNIEVLKQNRESLQELSYRLKIALDTSQIGIWELDITTGTLFWDERMKELYGGLHLKGTYEDWQTTLHPDDLKQAEAEFAAAQADGQSYMSQFRIVLPDGNIRHIRAIGSKYLGAGGRQKIVGVNWDVTRDVETNAILEEAKAQAEAHNTELEAARHRMEFNALHDPLTTLPNRRYLDQVLADRSVHSDNADLVSIFHVDLDRFKEINDTLGHAAGDEVLRHAAKVLRANTRDSDFVGRIGGDEFVIISKSGSTDISDTTMASRIIDEMSLPIRYKEQECRIGVSIGIAHQTRPDEERIQVLVNADIALYEAKRRGRNRYEVFTHSLKTAVIKSKQTADEILRGLEQNEFIAHFQPQFCPASLDIIGVEALARWDHPTKGLLAPHAFLKTAEDINVIADIDQRILEQALFQLHRWEASGIHIPKLSVNLSYQRLHDEHLIERLSQLTIPAGRLSFELLESISFDESDVTVLSNIERIKSLGIDIEIDDFGTGYASIVSLLKLTPRRLKIDRQLIIPILTSTKQRQLVASIIDIGSSLGIEVIAEGVETMEHAQALRELGCHGLQGYAFARPMSANDLANFARERKWLAA